MSSAIRAVFFDLSGVVYQDNQLIEGASEAIAFARSRGLTLRFVTNTATKSSQQILAQLRGWQVDIHEDELFTAPTAAKHYLINHGLKPLCLLHPALTTEFESFKTSTPNAVLLGDAREQLSYENLNRAFQLCQAGAPLVGIGMNKYFKSAGQLQLDAGGFIRLIEWAADSEAIIMGKPSPDFFHLVVASTELEAKQCLMIGDDVEADVIGAINAGLRGCLVKTGKYQESDNKQLPASTPVLDSIASLSQSDLFD